MALIKCPECNNDISDSAKTCPHCGYMISKARFLNWHYKNRFKIWIAIPLIALILVLMGLFYYNIECYSSNVKKTATSIIKSADDFLNGKIADYEYEYEVDELSKKIRNEFTTEKDKKLSVTISMINSRINMVVRKYRDELADMIEYEEEKTTIEREESLAAKQQKENEETEIKSRSIELMAEKWIELSENYDTLSDGDKYLVKVYADMIHESLTGLNDYIDADTGKCTGTIDDIKLLIRN